MRLPPISQTKSPRPRLPDTWNSCLLHAPLIAPAPISNVCFDSDGSTHSVIRFAFACAASTTPGAARSTTARAARRVLCAAHRGGIAAGGVMSGSSHHEVDELVY